MNGKRYKSFIAITLVAFVALFGAYPPSTFAAGPAVSGKYYGASWCGPCRGVKANPNFSKGLSNGSLRDFDIDAMPAGEVFPGGNVPQLHLFDAQGNPVGNPILGGGPDMANALQGLADQVVQQQSEVICIVPRPGQYRAAVYRRARRSRPDDRAFRRSAYRPVAGRYRAEFRRFATSSTRELAALPRRGSPYALRFRWANGAPVSPATLR
ncbi:MAG: hypothetical protein AAB649_04000, partial [Patescibacteria group bacterium]